MVKINGRTVPILAEALGGANVDNCPHPCVARPCGEDGECVPEMDYFTCRCKPGYRDQLCARGPPSFNGRESYLHFAGPQTLEALNSDPLHVNVRFKTTSTEGLLLWMNSGSPFDDENQGGTGSFLSLGLEQGALVLRFSMKGSEEEVVVVHNSSVVHDNLWHRIKAVRDGSSGVLVVDNGPAITRQSVEIPPIGSGVGSSANLVEDIQGLFVGGMPNSSLHLLTRYMNGVKSCVADLVLNSEYRLPIVNSNNRSSHHRDNEVRRNNVGECEV